MNTKNDFYLTSRYYSNVLKQATQYGIDCKVYGAICAVSEIKNAVPLVHDPEGCAYYPRFFPTDAIRMKLLGARYPPPIYSTVMTLRNTSNLKPEQIKEY